MLAHYNKENGCEHDLVDHLNAVSRLAAKFSAFDETMLTQVAAQLHDIGKAQPEFQDYIKNERGVRGSIKHALPGAALVFQERKKRINESNVLILLLENIIAGHHRGLYDMKNDWHKKFERMAFDCEYCTELVKKSLYNLQKIEFTEKELPYLEVLTRFSLSALVDADWLDTERAMNVHKSQKRSYESPGFKFFQQQFKKNLENRNLRPALSSYREQAHDAGADDYSFRELVLPTGYGKTFASMSYALEHAKRFEKHRIIVALPLLNLTAEMTSIYQDIMGEEHVIEDYSLVDVPSYDNEEQRNRLHLATENWDRPFVITTTVQLFESIFAHKPRKLRKLHRLANSVLILDEYHLLPPHLMQPIFQMLDVLQQRFGITVLLVSATNIPFDSSETIKKWDLGRLPMPITETVKLPQRVQYCLAGKLTARQVVEKIDERATLIIVNTRLQAQKLYEELKKVHKDRLLIYLTTTLVGNDRKERLREIKRSMNKHPVVISTQILEAGVDISFAVLYREYAPLPSVIQSAGRCNRYGELEKGEVHLFEWENPPSLSPVYQNGIEQLKAALKKGGVDVFFEEEMLAQTYRKLLSNEINNNPLPEQKLLFESTAKAFHMIDSYTIDVICIHANGFSKGWLIEDKTRAWWRKVQGFTVPLSPSTQGIIRRENLWLWESEYNEEIGIVLERGENR